MMAQEEFMNQYLSSVSLKSLAKGQLLGKYGTAIGALLLHMLCFSPLSCAITTAIGTNTLPTIFIYSIALFILQLFNGYFRVGQIYISLKIACNQTPSVKDLFHFFRGDSSKLISIQAVLGGVYVLCNLPLLIVQHYVNRSITHYDINALNEGQLPVNAALFLTYALLYVANLVIVIYVRYLLLSQAFFLMLDFPEYSASQLLKMSIQLMKGSKGRLLYLRLSFIPLLFLGLFSCGIALLWIIPYINTTLANFYLDLIKKKNQSS